MGSPAASKILFNGDNQGNMNDGTVFFLYPRSGAFRDSDDTQIYPPLQQEICILEPVPRVVTGSAIKAILTWIYIFLPVTGNLTDQQAFGLANPSKLKAATIYYFTKDVLKKKNNPKM